MSLEGFCHIEQLPCCSTWLMTQNQVPEAVFVISPGTESTACLSNLFPVLHHPFSKNMFPDGHTAHPAFGFVSLVPVTRNYWWKSPFRYSHTLHPPFKYLHRLIRSLLSLPFSRHNGPSSLSLPSHMWYPSPLTTLVSLYWSLFCTSMSLLYRKAQNWTQYYKCGLTSAE